jgi:hypothetical protein
MTLVRATAVSVRLETSATLHRRMLPAQRAALAMLGEAG